MNKLLCCVGLAALLMAPATSPAGAAGMMTARCASYLRSCGKHYHTNASLNLCMRRHRRECG